MVTNPTEAAMREAFEAHGKDRGWFLTHNPECLEAYLSVKTTSHWITWQAGQAHSRAEAGAEYRNGFDDGLNSAAEYVERVYGIESIAYEIRGLQPPATLAEPQPTRRQP
jgi:hypothetical protein